MRQIAIISTGATTSRATASLSCGRNSPLRDAAAVQAGDQAEAAVDDVGLVEAGEVGKLVQLADQQPRQDGEPPVADHRREHAATAAAAAAPPARHAAAAMASARSRLGTISVRTSASNTASLLGK